MIFLNLIFNFEKYLKIMDKLSKFNPNKQGVTVDTINNKPKKTVFNYSSDDDEANKIQVTDSDNLNKNGKNKNVFGKNSDIFENDKYDVNNDNNFDKALKKDLYHGKKGRMLFELEQRGKGDSRFSFSNKFKDDVETEKVSKRIKSVTDAFDINANDDNNKVKSVKDKNKGIEKVDQESLFKEKNRNLALLYRLLSNTEFFDYKVNRKQQKSHDLILKRFDPLIGLGEDLVRRPENVKDSNKHSGVVKLDKGFQNVTLNKSSNEDNDINKFFNPKKKINENKEKATELDLTKVINEFQTKELKEIKVEVNYNFFASLVKGNGNVNTQTEDNTNLNLNEKNIMNPSPEKETKEGSNMNNSKDNNNSIKIEETNKHRTLNDNNLSESNKIYEEKRVKRELQKEKKREERLLEKKRKLEKIEKKKLKDEKNDKKFAISLEKDHDKEKVDNYLRMIKLVSGVRKLA